MSSTSIERASAAGPRVPRTRLDRIAEWYRASPVGTWGVVVINALFQTAGIGFAFSLGTSTLALKCVLSVMTSLSLIWRRNWPLMIVISNNVALMMKMIKNNTPDFLLPLLVAVYTLIAIASVRDRLLGIAATVVFMFIPYLASFNGPLPGLMEERVPLSDFMQEAGFLIVVVTVASITRSRRETLEHGDAQLASHAAEQQLVVQRDAARYQARVAADLHDSVGHSLTAIIALSEGLHGASGIPDVDEAIDLVNSLARDGLADTRNAVASLQSSPPLLDDFGSGTVTSTRPEVVADVRGWDQLEDLLCTVRATGISAALTETGRRPSDTAVGRALGELVYIVIREALTNVMRHAEGATRVVVSLDHTGSSTRVTVSDDGQVTVHANSSQNSHEPPTGHGLTNLASVIHERGGALEVGPSIAPGSGGWVLRAVVPVYVPDLEKA
ncbi:sensor histidine kinase [Actinomyces naeslundii]|uniref:sensor histidine kinase n=1 Tax=Actinomyces naeslundii TaxID=1655 RepID=UPI00096C2282|nr:histidine kinase [Actinomyces naeslundii]OMG13668.1 two-component sensor histidine kinase [Actinomyces naeslundii]OMG23943.1 two-component sensor histidine kinase [Actinomyces naeslundii]